MSEHIQELAEHLQKVFSENMASETDTRSPFVAVAEAVHGLKCVVMSPDGIPLATEPHDNVQAAVQYAAGWITRFVPQGYYLDNRQQHLTLDYVVQSLELRYVFDESEEGEG